MREDHALKNHPHGTLTIILNKVYIISIKSLTKPNKIVLTEELDLFIIIGIKGKEEQFHILYGIISEKACGH